MNNSIAIGFLIISAIESFIFAVLFSNKNEKKLSDKILGVWLLVLAVQTIFIAVSLENQSIHFTIKQLQTSILLLHGPFLLLYTEKIINKNAIFRLKDFWHFSPFILFIVTALFFNLLHFQFELFAKIIAISGIISGIIYNSLVLNKLLWHRKQIQNDFSFTDKIDLNWLMKLSIGVFVIWIVGSVAGTLVRFFDYQIPIEWLFLFVPVFVFYIGFQGIKQQFIYVPQKTEKPTLPEKETEIIQQPDTQLNIRYKKSGLQTSDMEKISIVLEKIMTDEKLFLNPQLTLIDLSEKTSIPAHHITQTLNEYCKQNFHDFVNRYRVEEFKAQLFLPTNKSFSLLGIALDCGFNSKSSFNRIFKKFTSKTPSEYKKLHSIE